MVDGRQETTVSGEDASNARRMSSLKIDISRVFWEKRQAGKRNVLGAFGFRHHTHRRVSAPNRRWKIFLRACVLYKRAPPLSIERSRASFLLSESQD